MKKLQPFQFGFALVLAALFTISLAPRITAEEGGSGHYKPGAYATFFDHVSAKHGSTFNVHFNYYSGDTTEALPIGGQPRVGITEEYFSINPLYFYTAESGFLGGKYSFGLTVPMTKIDVQETLTGPTGNTFRRGDESGDIGDLSITPIAMAWRHGYWQTDFLFSVYAPLGSYDVTDIANVSQGYWSYEPTIAIHYFNPDSLFNFGLTTGANFNDKNDDTDYDSGDSVHFEFSLTKFFARDRHGMLGFGLNSTYYEQFTADKGSGAFLGDMHGRTVTVGPTLSYAFKNAYQSMTVEFKWLPEVEVKNRLKGDYFWLKFGWDY